MAQKKIILKERYCWTQWDTLLREFYNAIYAANRGSQKTGETFSQKLKERLEGLKDKEEVFKLIQKKPELCCKVIQVLPCGQKTIYTFIAENQIADEVND